VDRRQGARGRDLLGGSGASSNGQAEKALKVQTSAHLENPTLGLPFAFAFAAGQRPTEVIGPLLEDEAAAGEFLEGEGIIGLHRRGGVVLPLISRLC
jgi:hypothetical protein